MQRTFTGFSALLVLIALMAIGAFLFASFAFVFALLAPVGALWFLAVRLRLARMLWRSRGRLPGPVGLRMVGADRTRRLALAEVLTGVSGLALSAVPALIVFVGLEWGAGALVGALGLGAIARGQRRKALTDMPDVEILPPE